ncbi:hypothetical protein [Bradyrhizobium uaiense]|uniref:Uncharacterized protein n=1 Tax=Bradyrhizobium uaiense TaxID=2594946 RepID=A0A6P1BUF1_9BRAD|nr:hypothetical protein [Bradyrhizobium uaiense]NEV01824.1 hypothetical protein [Bradyrhizobium uaiense]
MAYSIEKASPFIARTNDYARCRQAERKKFRFLMAAMDFDRSLVASLDRPDAGPRALAHVQHRDDES